MDIGKDTLVVNVISFNSILNPIVNGKIQSITLKSFATIRYVLFRACVNFDDI